MTDTIMETPAQTTHSDDKITYTRFDISQRVEHMLFLLSFSILGFTGLIQKFSTYPLSDYFIYALGGIERVRILHHYSAVLMMIVSGYHVIVLAYKVIVLRVPWTMMPLIDHAKHVYQDVLYFIGIRKHRAYYGRYNYAEKAEYLAVVWGTVIMGLTGFMMWNPLSTTQLLPGAVIPAAKAAHGAEAILADRFWRESGRVFGFCNCCSCDCYPIRSGIALGMPRQYPRAWYVADRDAEMCTFCGNCVDRCQFHAFHYADKVEFVNGRVRQEIEFDPERCWGCGLCSTGCPESAITMRPLRQPAD